MSWSEALVGLLVCHVVGDVLLQTDWQAVNKTGGLARAGSGRALLCHLAAYTSAFMPVLVWIAVRTTALRALAVAVVVVISHLLIDDGRVVSLWLRRVKHVPQPTAGLSIAVDQSFHLVCLLGAALLAQG